MHRYQVFFFFSKHTVHIDLITIGYGVRDRVHVICNASAWCHALYPCQVLYINIHLAPILLFPSCHPAYMGAGCGRYIQYSTGQDSRAGRNYCFHFFLTDSFLLNVKTPGLRLPRAKRKSFFYGFCLTSRFRFKQIQLKDAYTKKKNAQAESWE